jgi:hypothetical protein
VTAIQELRAEFGEAPDLYSIWKVEAYIHNVKPGWYFISSRRIVPKPKLCRKASAGS